MTSAKMAILDLLTSKLFWIKGFNVKISAHDVTNKILISDLYCVLEVVMWPMFGNSSTTMTEVTITSIKDLTRKNTFLRGGLGSSSIIWIGPRCGLEISLHCVKRVKTISQKVLEASSNVCRSFWKKKLVVAIFCFPLPILNRAKMHGSKNTQKFEQLSILFQAIQGDYSVLM